MKSIVMVMAVVAACGAGGKVQAVTTPVLGTAEHFAVLGHTTVTNTGSSVIFGSAAVLSNVGVFNEGGANATTGFAISPANSFIGPGSNTNGPGLVNAPAAIHLGSPTAGLARNDLIAAHTALSNFGTANDLTGRDLGTSGSLPIGTLVAGVYSFDTSAQLNGALQLDAQGTNGGVWIIQIGSTLTTASASSVELINAGSNGGSDVGVFWVVGTSATLGTTTMFEGNILAMESITLDTDATIYNGRALAYNGAVSLDSNIISNICPDFDLEHPTHGPGSTSPNSGPGFSSGIGFDEAGDLVLTGPGGTGPGGPGGLAIPEPGTTLLAACGLALLLTGLFSRSAARSRAQLVAC